MGRFLSLASFADLQQAQFDAWRQDFEARIDTLRGNCEAARDESEALRACLEREGLLGREQFLAQMHRRRFARTLARHPCQFEAAPVEVMHNLELFRNAMRYAGMQAARCTAAASRTLSLGTEILPPRLYAVGGSDGAKVLSTAERFDERSAKWEAVPPMPTPRSNLVALGSEGQLYAIGGTNGSQVSGTVEVFDEEGNSWRPLPPMPTPRSGMAAAACGGRLYVVGGREGFTSLGVAERFCAGMNHWEALPPMHLARRFLAAATLDGKLYAIGGEDDGLVALRTAERFDEATNSWESLPPMPTRRRGLAAVALRGRLYAIGGGTVALGSGAPVPGAATPRGARTSALGTVERFDPATCLWETLPPLPTPRMFLQAVVLNGNLYAIGGSDGAQALRTVERFDEASNSWESFPPMPNRRVFFAVAVLRG